MEIKLQLVMLESNIAVFFFWAQPLSLHLLVVNFFLTSNLRFKSRLGDSCYKTSELLHRNHNNEAKFTNSNFEFMASRASRDLRGSYAPLG